MSKSQVCRWDFTLPEKDTTLDELKIFLQQYCRQYVFQLEEGKETKFRHYQGRVTLKVKKRKGPAKEGYHFHWSPTSNANRDNDFYCLKEDTRILGPWTDKDPYIPRQVREVKTLLPWQQQIYDDADNWDKRHINVIYDVKGEIGKSTLVSYLMAHGRGRRIPCMDSYKDYMQMVMDAPKSKLYLVDFPRSISHKNTASFWSAIETIKDGYAYDARNHFREMLFDCPNIWVFTNQMPDVKALTTSRWLLWEVNTETLELEPYVDETDPNDP